MQLRVATRGETRPVPLDTDAEGVHVWRTPDGDFIAHGYRQGSTCWMHWPSVAAFRFADGDPFITAFVEPGASPAVVEDVYRRAVLPMALQALGDEALHASGVLTTAGVVAFAARSHTGKSTFAYALSRRGFVQWADDGVVVRVADASVTTFPLPFSVRLRPESSHLFGFAEHVFRQFEPAFSVPAGTAAPLTAICLLQQMDEGSTGAPAVVQRVEPIQAFTAVLIHAHEFNPHDTERRRRMLKAYLALADVVPVYEVMFRPGVERLDAVLDIVTESLGLTPTPAPVGMGA